MIVAHNNCYIFFLFHVVKNQMDIFKTYQADLSQINNLIGNSGNQSHFQCFLFTTILSFFYSNGIFQHHSTITLFYNKLDFNMRPILNKLRLTICWK